MTIYACSYNETIIDELNTMQFCESTANGQVCIENGVRGTCMIAEHGGRIICGCIS